MGGAVGEKIGVVGLGYVGLPVALAFAKAYPETVGYDISRERVDALRSGEDPSGESEAEELRETSLRFTTELDDLRGTTFFVVAVPTPVDKHNRPDFSPLIQASEAVGRVLGPGAVVVYESTVYPGVTEEICGPILARASGLRQGEDFKLAYSPERINPGDKTNTFSNVVKIVSGEDGPTLERVAAAYGAIVPAGVFQASSIKVAEAAKVIENSQRDINIALMNEVAMICDRLQIRTADVVSAMRTKWNALPFSPGLVGGHCIGVDPYYLTHKAEELGYLPQVILAGRRINNSMGQHVAQRLIKLLARNGGIIKGARVGVMGLTFKENVSDIRNSRVPEIIRELRDFGATIFAHDPYVKPGHAEAALGIGLSELSDLKGLDALVLAVAHRPYLELDPEDLFDRIRRGGILVDVKSFIDPKRVPDHLSYWSL